MNLNRIIKNLKGEESQMSIPSKDIIDKLPKLENGRPDFDKLPRETVRNVLLNCLANYAIKDKKDIFYVQTCAQAIIGEEETVELKDKFHKFLIEVVYDMTLREDKGEKVGLYYSWVMAQVLDELGIKNEE